MYNFSNNCSDKIVRNKQLGDDQTYIPGTGLIADSDLVGQLDYSSKVDDFFKVTSEFEKYHIKVRIWRGPEQQYELEFSTLKPRGESVSVCFPIGKYKNFNLVKEDSALWTKVLNLSKNIQIALQMTLL